MKACILCGKPAMQIIAKIGYLCADHADRAEPRCDFCSVVSPDPSWRYPVKDFLVFMATDENASLSGSRGDWMACEACRALIEAGNWNELAGRTLGSIEEDRPDDNLRSLRLALIGVLHVQFNANRAGPAIRAGSA